MGGKFTSRCTWVAWPLVHGGDTPYRYLGHENQMCVQDATQYLPVRMSPYSNVKPNIMTGCSSDITTVYTRALASASPWPGRSAAPGKIGRFVPSAAPCSGCGANEGSKPLRVREWACGACGAAQDRDHNAAKNILAAGRADNANACGGDVRQGPALAVAGETGTLRGAA
jgi:Putative transposase DNA-binding domain